MKTSLTYCIKDFSDTNRDDYADNFIFKFIKDKTYTIRYYNDDDNITPIHIIDENKSILKFHEISNFNKNIRNEHFISLQQARQLKLKKINEIRI